jgi:hypothetical protein
LTSKLKCEDLLLHIVDRTVAKSKFWTYVGVLAVVIVALAIGLIVMIANKSGIDPAPSDESSTTFAATTPVGTPTLITKMMTPGTHTAHTSSTTHATGAYSVRGEAFCELGPSQIRARRRSPPQLFQRQNHLRYRPRILFLWFVGLGRLILGDLVLSHQLSDGMGPSYLTGRRRYRHCAQPPPHVHASIAARVVLNKTRLALNDALVGTSRTAAKSSLVTDRCC